MGDQTRRTFLTLLAGAVVAACREPVAVAPISTASSTTTTTRRPTSTAVAPPPSSAPTTTTTTLQEPLSIPVLCGESWGARPPAGPWVRHDVSAITVHHTAVRLDDNADAPGRIRTHQRHHQRLGWPDLAYHHVIDAAGNVYEGRPLGVRGDTGTSYDPTGHYLVCLEGDFDDQPVPAAQWARLVEVLSWATASFGVDPAAVAGHGDLAPETTCPGSAVAGRIAAGDLAESIRRQQQVDLEVVCGAGAADVVATIEASSEASPSANA